MQIAPLGKVLHVAFYNFVSLQGCFKPLAKKVKNLYTTGASLAVVAGCLQVSDWAAIKLYLKDLLPVKYNLQL